MCGNQALCIIDSSQESRRYVPCFARRRTYRQVEDAPSEKQCLARARAFTGPAVPDQPLRGRRRLCTASWEGKRLGKQASMAGMAALKPPMRGLGSCSAAHTGMAAALQRLSLAPSTSGRRGGLCVEGAHLAGTWVPWSQPCTASLLRQAASCVLNLDNNERRWRVRESWGQGAGA